MVVEELNSAEAADLLLRSKTTPSAENRTLSSTSSSIEETGNSTNFESTTLADENITTEFIKNITDFDRNEESAEAESTTTPEEEAFSHNSTASDPVLEGFLGKKDSNLETSTSKFQTPPDSSFSVMVNAAKDFVKRYLTNEQWRNLRRLLRTIKEVGGSRDDVHRAATSFISKVVSKVEMSEILNRREELFKTFNKRFFRKV
ncbi:unnamed protein product [Caenorhabditis auriculariae]|uniref:Uncharacterized protein n=1 Tax=Caenorhabditis auriculariae TaxID=2777116 RepID=A0A8S1GU08_9PELO|nr:unnamed protein product [Caenorhabditis auriculariae]